ncbi:Acg family FMN-binding oxidoreductase [Nocardia miyunensis]|uniref:Acg family FMN-binding oxidoreductase n=1 Tax=Nocardia miyunensis TaxID=282684 RepID=UPI0008340396|nr:nitroreductase family protein [Nocardia miyunensis]
MSHTHPDADTLRSALQLAVRAPSVHNTQPWQWRVGEQTVHLYADPARRLPHTDPDGRDLLISCGAALHHLCAGVRAFGWTTRVHRLPNPAEPDHLAAVEFRPEPPTPEAIRLAQAIERRRSDRRRYTSWEVTGSHIAELVEVGQSHGVLVRNVGGDYERARLLRAFERAAQDHARDFEYGAELHQWSGRHAAAQGVPAHSAVISTDPTVRRFADPGLPQAVLCDIDGEDSMLLLSTPGDERISQLRAGEATSAIMLTATVMGLASCPLTEPLEITATRAAVRSEVLHDSGFPQMIIRLGWAAQSADPLPATPRRPMDQVIRPL